MRNWLIHALGGMTWADHIRIVSEERTQAFTAGTRLYYPSRQLFEAPEPIRADNQSEKQLEAKLLKNITQPKKQKKKK